MKFTEPVMVPTACARTLNCPPIAFKQSHVQVRASQFDRDNCKFQPFVAFSLKLLTSRQYSYNFT